MAIERTQSSLYRSRCFFQQSHMFTPSKLNIWLGFPCSWKCTDSVPRVEHEKAFSRACSCTCRGYTGVLVCTVSMWMCSLIQCAECTGLREAEDWCWDTFVSGFRCFCTCFKHYNCLVVESRKSCIFCIYSVHWLIDKVDKYRDSEICNILHIMEFLYLK